MPCQFTRPHCGPALDGRQTARPRCSEGISPSPPGSPDGAPVVSGRHRRGGRLTSIGLAVFVAGALAVVGCGDGESVLLGPSTTAAAAVPTTAAPDTSVTTAAPPAALPFRWEAAVADGGFGGPGYQRMQDVASFSGGLVGVGADSGSAAVWFSPDGLLWSRVPGNEAAFSDDLELFIIDVTAGAPGIVAVGQQWDRRGAVSDLDAAAWHSEDGRTWSRSDPDGLGGAGDQQMRAVVAAGPGFVAAGYELHDEYDAAVWVSPDGVSWSRSAGNGVLEGPGDRQIWDLAASAEVILAVGSVDGRAAVWTSVDGTEWARVDEWADPEEAAGEMLAVVEGGPGWVAVGRVSVPEDAAGYTRAFDAVVWTSPDAIRWSRVPEDRGVFGGRGDQVMLSVAAGEFGVVAVGWEGSGVSSDTVVWWSPDGQAWIRGIPTFPGEDVSFFAFDSVIAAGPGLVAVGRQVIAGMVEEDAAVWVAEWTGG